MSSFLFPVPTLPLFKRCSTSASCSFKLLERGQAASLNQQLSSSHLPQPSPPCLPHSGSLPSHLI